jgi:hypothetical protein
MAVEDVNSIVVGDNIRFKTISPHDNVYWQGTVTAMAGYSVARQFGGRNLDAYYQEVKWVDINIAPLESSTFLLVQVMQDGISNTLVIAKDWIDTSTLERISLTAYHDLRIHNIDSTKFNDVVQLLKETYPDYPIEIL